MAKTKNPLRIVETNDTCIIYDGGDVFKRMDTHGLPLEMLINWLAASGGIFEWPGFVAAALKSGNYGRDKLLRIVREAWAILGKDIRGTAFEERLLQLIDS